MRFDFYASGLQTSKLPLLPKGSTVFSGNQTPQTVVVVGQKYLQVERSEISERAVADVRRGAVLA